MGDAQNWNGTLANAIASDQGPASPPHRTRRVQGPNAHESLYGCCHRTAAMLPFGGHRGARRSRPVGGNPLPLQSCLGRQRLATDVVRDAIRTFLEGIVEAVADLPVGTGSRRAAIAPGADGGTQAAAIRTPHTPAFEALRGAVVAREKTISLERAGGAGRLAAAGEPQACAKPKDGNKDACPHLHVTSTLRLSERPASVPLSAMGWDSPAPSADRRCLPIPRSASAATTAAARRSDSSRL